MQEDAPLLPPPQIYPKVVEPQEDMVKKRF